MHGVAHLGLDARAPARQHLGRRRYPLARLAVVAPARGEPQLDRVAQTLMVDAGPAVNRTQERQALVGRHRAVAPGDQVEAGLDVAAVDGVERTIEPVAEIEVRIAPVAALGNRRAAMASVDVFLAGVAESGQGARPARSPAGSSPPATRPSSSWAWRRAWSGVTLP